MPVGCAVVATDRYRRGLVQLVEVTVEHTPDLELFLLAARVHHVEPLARQMPLDCTAHQLAQVGWANRVEFARQLAALQDSNIAVSIAEPAIARVRALGWPQCRLQLELDYLLWLDPDVLR